jgi:methylenetetrahydrofolate--tRNA-(uracil-5-)-methyltransferase
MGLVAGINAARLAAGTTIVPPPPETALGALIRHLTTGDPKHFQPSNVNFGLFPAWEKKTPKRLRGRLRAEIAVAALQRWRYNLAENG